jgi:hypothetical protein
VQRMTQLLQTKLDIGLVSPWPLPSPLMLPVHAHMHVKSDGNLQNERIPWPPARLPMHVQLSLGPRETRSPGVPDASSPHL